jgi:hypothetical protein
MADLRVPQPVRHDLETDVVVAWCFVERRQYQIPGLSLARGCGVCMADLGVPQPSVTIWRAVWWYFV